MPSQASARSTSAVATYAVILAGGGGTRLWPASRRARPKQFLALGSRPGESLLAGAVRRLEELVGAGRTLVVTAAAQAEQAAAALSGAPGTEILAEPAARNTAAAIGLAAAHLIRRDPDAVLAVIPADQHVGDEDRFRTVVAQAAALAGERDAIVTIGIKPTRPETGYGYLELAGPPPDAPAGVESVARFVEKPDRATAERYLAGGRHLWNGGMFFFRAARLLAELDRCMPAHGAAFREIAAAADPSAAAARLYPALPPVSIDYGVMEKTGGILTLAGDFGWNDVGAWPALADIRPADAQGNVAAGLLAAHESRGNVVAADPGVLVALVGVDDLVVVQSGDAILVAPRSRAQDVKEIVAQLERRKLETYL